MNSRDVIKRLKKEGFEMVRVTGSHHHFMKPGHQSIVTVPHPKKDLPKGTLKSIEKQSGIRF